MDHPGRRWYAAAAAVIAGALAVGCTVDDAAESAGILDSPAPSTSAAVPPEAQPIELKSAGALEKLATIPIKGRAPKTGYDRRQFGDAWTDDVSVPGGRNGCDTRNDILRRDLADLELRPGSNGCAVLSGTLHDPYTGSVIAFQRGRDTSAEVQIDHVVALSDAWQKGAQQWDELKRRNFANDPMNLQATAGWANQQKGDGDAATWLPPNRSYRCTYVSRIVDVKAGYGLWMTQAEHDAIARILGNCDDAGPPVDDGAPPPPPAAVAPASIPPPPPAAGEGSTVYYPNCRAAREAGAAPIFAGQPGYRTGLDGDGDGIACE
ncbi:GmrSD restriction endonuclease domain-containing protein [Mycolicibacterium thermoresistibile]